MLLIGLFGAGTAFAQSSGGTYTLRKFEVTGGGKSQGSPYNLVATVGQKVAGVQTGGSYKLISGFHQPKSVDGIFCDGFENNTCASAAKSAVVDRIR